MPERLIWLKEIDMGSSTYRTVLYFFFQLNSQDMPMN